jgi:hypothetical protein
MRRLRQVLLGTALVMLPLAGSPADAAVVGLNFATGQSGGEVNSLAANQVAGAVPQGNWNNVTGNTGGQANVLSPVAGVLVDDAGLPTTLTLTSFTSTNNWSTYGSTQADPNRQLLNSYLDNTNGETPTTITMSGVPAAYQASGYALLVYVGSDQNGRTGTVAVTSPALATPTYTFSTSTSPFDGTYTRSTSTTLAAAAAAEYVRFDGLTAPTFTFTVTRGSNNVGLHGVQILQVPEPGTAGLLGLAAAAGLLARRRRAD